VTRAGERAQVSGVDQQVGTEEWAEAGHGLDDRGLRVLGEQLADLPTTKQLVDRFRR
jgi:hypothetical protein